MTEREKVAIPRVTSRAPKRNTLEWEIPGKVSACLMLIERIGYTFVIKIKVDKRHWWNSSTKTFIKTNLNVMELIAVGAEYLEKHGYYIDANTVKYGEPIR